MGLSFCIHQNCLKGVNKLCFELLTKSYQQLGMEWLFTLTWLLMSKDVFGDIIDFPDYECAKNQYYNPISLGK